VGDYRGVAVARRAMYHLAVTVTQTVGCSFCRAILSDFDESGVGIVIATHGPWPVEAEPDLHSSGLEMLDTLVRYATYLESDKQRARDVVNQ
jgi:hypothetical protein